MSFLVAPRGRLSQLIHSHCASAGVLADRVGLAAEVREALAYFFERWDGSGLPLGARGDAIPVEMRVVQLADVAEVHLRLGGVDGAVGMARSRSGTQFDPAIAATFDRCAGEILEGLPDDVWRAALAQAPDRDRLLTEDELDGLLEAMGDFVDLKCPFTLGHSRGVAALAAEAGRRCGLPGPDVKLLRRAGLVHDLGRMGVSNAIWEKPGPLSAGEWERVRLHPYLTGRILSRVRGLEPVAALAAAHHERQDGSGYPRAVGGGALTPPARLLAAADAYHAMVEPRPHRGALSEGDAAERLRRQARESRLDAQAVDAVLEAAGHRVPRRKAWPAGLTTREVEVLRLVAQGRPTAASPAICPSARRPSATTSSTSTASSPSPTGPAPACSPSSTASSAASRARQRKDGAAAPCPDRSLPAILHRHGSSDGGYRVRDGRRPRDLAGASIRFSWLPGDR